MAKGLRNKWARARRSEKRERYAKKELAKLQTLVKNRETREALMIDIKKAIKKENNGESITEHQFTLRSKKKSKSKDESLTSPYDPTTLKNKHGNYPVWMNSRAIKRFKNKVRRNKLTKKNKKF